MSRSDAVTACSGAAPLSPREKVAVLRTSEAFCEVEASFPEVEDDIDDEGENGGGEKCCDEAERWREISATFSKTATDVDARDPRDRKLLIAATRLASCC